MNEESFIDNFEAVFGCKFDSLAKRIILYFSDGKKNARIDFNSFLGKIAMLINEFA